jgi:hypothetical protein
MKSSHLAYQEFKELYYEDLMLILHYQRTAFPDTMLHGYAHIARCLILTHALAKLHELSYEDEMKCLIAIGLHDSAREGDGEDVWEEESGKIAIRFCREKGFSEEFQNDVFKLITEKTYYHSLPNKKFIVCHDADCLDIIRCFGIHDFDTRHFVSFRDNAQLRNDLIKDTCTLIDHTYLDESDFDNVNSLFLMESRMKGRAWGDKFIVINPYKK